MKNRLKNYGFWIALASFVFIFVQKLGFNITPTEWDLYVNSILGILVVAGIVNNPDTQNAGFGDDPGKG